MNVRFDPDAQTEYFEAIQYYEQQAQGLGARFIADIEHTIGRIVAYPKTWGLLTLNTRRALLEGVSVWDYLLC